MSDRTAVPTEEPADMAVQEAASATPSRSIGAIIAGLALSIVGLAFSNLLAIVFLIVGAVNVDNCPVQPKIPKYLIVSGALTIALAVIRFCTNMYQTKLGQVKAEGKPPRAVMAALGVILVGAFVWLIFGMIWTFGANPTYEPGQPTYCHYWTYMLAYLSFVFIFIMVGLSCCCCCCAGAIGVCIANQKDEETEAKADTA